eukprot:3354824-Alexandrium_andersonii.AAC.1
MHLGRSLQAVRGSTIAMGWARAPEMQKKRVVDHSLPHVNDHHRQRNCHGTLCCECVCSITLVLWWHQHGHQHGHQHLHDHHHEHIHDCQHPHEHQHQHPPSCIGIHMGILLLLCGGGRGGPRCGGVVVVLWWCCGGAVV